jgi:hypothetical protein
LISYQDEYFQYVEFAAIKEKKKRVRQNVPSNHYSPCLLVLSCPGKSKKQMSIAIG